MIHRLRIRLDRAGHTQLEGVAARHRLSAEALVRHAAMYAIAGLDSGRATPEMVLGSTSDFDEGGRTLLVELDEFGFERIREAGELYDLAPEAVLRGAVAHYLQECGAGRIASTPLFADRLAKQPQASRFAEPAAVTPRAAPRPRRRSLSRALSARRGLAPGLATLAAAACAAIVVTLPGQDGIPPKRTPPVTAPPHPRPPSCPDCGVDTGSAVMAFSTGLTEHALRLGAQAFSTAVSPRSEVTGPSGATKAPPATTEEPAPKAPSSTDKGAAQVAGDSGSGNRSDNRHDSRNRRQAGHRRRDHRRSAKTEGGSSSSRPRITQSQGRRDDRIGGAARRQRAQGGYVGRDTTGADRGVGQANRDAGQEPTLGQAVGARHHREREHGIEKNGSAGRDGDGSKSGHGGGGGGDGGGSKSGHEDHNEKSSRSHDKSHRGKRH